MSRYIPGPWELNEEQPDVIFINSDNNEICAIPLEEDNEPANNIIRANARLMSKAPEMYEMIKEFQRHFYNASWNLNQTATIAQATKLLQEIDNE